MPSTDCEESHTHQESLSPKGSPFISLILLISHHLLSLSFIQEVSRFLQSFPLLPRPPTTASRPSGAGAHDPVLEAIMDTLQIRFQKGSLRGAKVWGLKTFILICCFLIFQLTAMFR